MYEIIGINGYREDYNQSSNALFHFMKEQRFLNAALMSRALYPRYCLEDISYLGLTNNRVKFDSIAVLQKCFCDIPLHKVAARSETQVIDIKSNESIPYDNGHTECYGKFAVAFSKTWGEKNGLQPIHYLNADSQYVKQFKNVWEAVIARDELPEELSTDVLMRMVFMKPLRGKMERLIEFEGSARNVLMYKNFYDEQEWRYVPDPNKLMEIAENAAIKLDVIIANPYEVEWRSGGFFEKQSSEFLHAPYDAVKLCFNYDELRYIIVPDEQARLDTIKQIMELPKENFMVNIEQERYLLISKILVLQEIRKDW